MRRLPETDDALLLRTDFSDTSVWESICIAVTEPVGEFKAYVEFLSDPEYDGLAIEHLPSLIPDGSSRGFIFVVDRLTIAYPEHPILAIDLRSEPGRTFRVLPSAMWAVENNLSIANMDFAEFADATDSDGVFRGFPAE